MSDRKTSARPIPPLHPIPRHRRVGADYYRTYSPKAGRYVEFESSLEYEIWLLFESDPRVAALREQTPQIYIEGREKPYTFDLWVRFNDLEERPIQTKPESKLVEDASGKFVPENWDSITAASQQAGWDPIFLTNRTTEKRRQFIDNWDQLLPYVKTALKFDTQRLQQRILSIVHDGHEVPIHEIEKRIPGEPEDRVVETIFLLIYQGKLLANLDSAPVSRDLEVQIPNDAT